MRTAGLRFFLAMALTMAAASAEETVEELMEKARVHDRALQAEPALQLYLRAEALQPERVEVLIGIARQYRHLMADAPTTAEKLRLLGLALKYSQRAVQSDGGSADAHLAVAITYGKSMAFKSSKEQLATSKLLRAEIDRTLKLNPQSDLAWHLLGRWDEGYAELSSVKRALGEMLYGALPTSSYEEAAKCFQKALAANPNRMMHYIELGRVYAQMGRTEEARKLLKKGLAMPNRDKDDPDYRKRGSETLAGLR